mmetsp:Transcript_119940/g.208294  ORF Transcript_119940/g.208294 Transcript_119940/m.208294 type:complete len:619 (-) Transcript_119940:124-1980(-)
MAVLLWTLLFACLMQGSHTQLLHSGEDCYNACFKQAGFCEWCGVGMACCQEGLYSDPAECQGDLNFKAAGYHMCVQPKYGPNETPPKSPPAGSPVPAPAPPVSSASLAQSGAPPPIAGLPGATQPTPSARAAPAPASSAPQYTPQPTPSPPPAEPQSTADLSDAQLMAMLNKGGGASGIKDILGGTIGVGPAPPPPQYDSYSAPAPPPSGPQITGAAQAAPNLGGAFSGAAPDLSATGYGAGSSIGQQAKSGAQSPSGSVGSPAARISTKAVGDDDKPKAWYHRGAAGSSLQQSSSGQASGDTSSGKSAKSSPLTGWIITLLILFCCCAVGALIVTNQNKKKAKQRSNFQAYDHNYERYPQDRMEQPPMYKEVPPMDPMMGPGRPGSMEDGRPGSMSMAMSNFPQEQMEWCPACGNQLMPDSEFCRKCGHRRGEPMRQGGQQFQSNLVPTDSIPSQTPWTSLQNQMAPSPVQPAVMQEVQAQPVTAPQLGPAAYSGLPPSSSAYMAAGYPGLGQTVAAPSTQSQFTAPQTIYPGATAASSILTGPTSHYNAPQTILPGSTVTPQASAPVVPSVTTPVVTSMQVQPATMQQMLPPVTQPMMASMQVSGGAYVAPARYVS